MDVILYSAMCYGITIVISLAVVAVIVGVNSILAGRKGGDE